MIYTIQSRLGEINWSALRPGDEVRIPYRPEPYRERIVVGARGTADAPIRIVGLKGPDGQRPVISGEGAVTDPQFKLSYPPLEPNGLITIHPTVATGSQEPGWLVFAGLEVRGANSDRTDRTFYGADGKAQQWSNAASGFYALNYSGLAIRDCGIYDCGNGVLSTDSKPCSDFLLEGCDIAGNGKIGSIFQHQTYVCAVRASYRNNTYGPIRVGALGGALKDRSADVLIENNTITSAARTIDLDSWEGTTTAVRQATPNAVRSIIRNNVLINRTGAQALYVGGRIGADGLGDDIRLLNNTVVIRLSVKKSYVVLLRPEYQPKVRIFAEGNLIDFDPFEGRTPELRILDGRGTLTLGRNWVRPAYSKYSSTGEPDRIVIGWENFVVSTAPAGFVAEGDYRLRPDAPAAGFGADLTPPSEPPPPPPVGPLLLGRIPLELLIYPNSEGIVPEMVLSVGGVQIPLPVSPA